MNTPCSALSKLSNNSANLTQYTLQDSLMLTPLINANLTVSGDDDTLHSMRTASSKASNESHNNSNVDSQIKIVRHESGDSHVYFPTVYVGQSMSVEFALSNQAQEIVKWKAFSLSSASIADGHTTHESKLTIFSISPQSGMIPPLQKQSIKIEFSPRGVAAGQFQQIFQIETRTDGSVYDASGS